MLRLRNVLLILLGLLLMLFAVLLGLRKQTLKNNARVVSNLIYGILLARGFSMITAGYITAQAAHETNDFTSPLFGRANNAFGMKFPEIRRTTAEGKTFNSYAKYRTVPDSVEDYILYWKHFAHPERYNNIEEFVARLKDKGYFEDKEETYLRGVKHWHDHYFKSNLLEI